MSDQKAEPVFVDGLIIKAPREGAPDFVKGSLSIKRAELIAWLTVREEEWINVDIKLSKAGKWYGQVNTWKKEESGGDWKDKAKAAIGYTDAPKMDAALYQAPPAGEVNLEDIPFS